MIFLSYSREDSNWAAKVTALLHAWGLRVACDPALVQGDAFWRQGVRQALEQSQIMIVLWSKHAVKSPWVDQEIRYFKRRKYFVLVDRTPLPQGEKTGSCVVWNSCCEVSTSGIYDLSGEIVAGVSRLSETIDTSWTRSSRFCGAPLSEWARSESNLEKVKRQRQDLLAAEEVRLERFCCGLGGRSLAVVRVEGRIMWLGDGSWLLRLQGESEASDSLMGAVYLGAMPVTNEQYQRFVSFSGYPPPPTWRDSCFRRPEAPVVGVTWFEAMAYSAWVGGDLPTGQEWEKAATGGDPEVEYATWNGEIGDGAAYFGFNFADKAPVSSSGYPANRLGFYGMCGNTWEWCSTREGPHRMIRGGSYLDSSRFCQAKSSYRNAPIDRDCSVGFRIKITVT